MQREQLDQQWLMRTRPVMVDLEVFDCVSRFMSSCINISAIMGKSTFEITQCSANVR
jgi:hypothetical protein